MRNSDHEWLRTINAFILCDLFGKVQRKTEKQALTGIINIEVTDCYRPSNAIDQQNVAASKLQVSINTCWTLIHEVQCNK